MKPYLLAPIILSICISTLSSQTWHTIQKPDGGQINCMVKAKSRLIVGTRCGIYVSTDTAKTWRYSDNPDLNQYIEALYSWGDTILALRRSTLSLYSPILSISFDAGDHWSDTAFPLLDLTSVIMDESGIWAGGQRGVKLSTDLGNNWQSVGDSDPNVYCMLSYKGDIFVVCDTGVLRYDRNTNSWQSISSEFPDSDSYSRRIRKMVIYNDTMYTLTDNGKIYRYSDEESRWMDARPDTTKSMSNLVASERAIYIFPYTDDYFYRGFNSAGWEIIPKSSRIVLPSALIEIGNRLYLSDGISGINYSDDDGLSWVCSSTGMKISDFYDIVIVDTTIFSICEQGMMWSGMDGENWSGIVGTDSRNIFYDRYNTCTYLFSTYTYYKISRSNDSFKIDTLSHPYFGFWPSIRDVRFSPTHVYVMLYQSHAGFIDNYVVRFRNGDTTYEHLQFSKLFAVNQSGLVGSNDDGFFNCDSNMHCDSIKYLAGKEVTSLYADDSIFYFGTTDGLLVSTLPFNTWRNLGLSGKHFGKITASGKKIAVELDSLKIALSENSGEDWRIFKLPDSISPPCDSKFYESLQISGSRLYLILNCDYQLQGYFAEINDIGGESRVKCVYKTKTIPNVEIQRATVYLNKTMTGRVHVMIVNLQGQCIYQKFTHSNTVKLPETIKPGIYHLLIKQLDNSYSAKFINIQ